MIAYRSPVSPMIRPTKDGTCSQGHPPSSNAGQLFRRGESARHHPSDQRVATALPQNSPDTDRTFVRSFIDFYLSHTPRLQRLNHVIGQDHAPATKPAAEVLPVLVMLFVVWVTWLVELIPRANRCMSGLPLRHSFASTRRARISGGRTQKLPLTPQRWFFTDVSGLTASERLFRHRLPNNSPVSPIRTWGLS